MKEIMSQLNYERQGKDIVKFGRAYLAEKTVLFETFSDSVNIVDTTCSVSCKNKVFHCIVSKFLHAKLNEFVGWQLADSEELNL